MVLAHSTIRRYLLVDTSLPLQVRWRIILLKLSRVVVWYTWSRTWIPIHYLSDVDVLKERQIINTSDQIARVRRGQKVYCKFLLHYEWKKIKFIFEQLMITEDALVLLIWVSFSQHAGWNTLNNITNTKCVSGLLGQYSETKKHSELGKLSKPRTLQLFTRITNSRHKSSHKIQLTDDQELKMVEDPLLQVHFGNIGLWPPSLTK